MYFVWLTLDVHEFHSAVLYLLESDDARLQSRSPVGTASCMSWS